MHIKVIDLQCKVISPYSCGHRKAKYLVCIGFTGNLLFIKSPHQLLRARQALPICMSADPIFGQDNSVLIENNFNFAYPEEARSCCKGRSGPQHMAQIANCRNFEGSSPQQSSHCTKLNLGCISGVHLKLNECEKLSLYTKKVKEQVLHKIQ